MIVPIACWLLACWFCFHYMNPYYVSLYYVVESYSFFISFEFGKWQNDNEDSDVRASPWPRAVGLFWWYNLILLFRVCLALLVVFSTNPFWTSVPGVISSVTALLRDLNVRKSSSLQPDTCIPLGSWSVLSLPWRYHDITLFFLRSP